MKNENINIISCSNNRAILILFNKNILVLNMCQHYCDRFTNMNLITTLQVYVLWLSPFYGWESKVLASILYSKLTVKSESDSNNSYT